MANTLTRYVKGYFLKKEAVVLAHLVEQSLQTPEVRGSNTDSGNLNYCTVRVKIIFVIIGTLKGLS